MDYVLYLLRALYRVKWWILLGTALITAIVYFRTGNLRGGYNVEATLYTGVVSGYGVEESTKVDWALAQNSMDNLINIIQAESTLKRVSLRLFSRILVKGSPDKDNEKPQQAEVIAVGPGGMVNGKEVEMHVTAGQQVIYSKYAGTNVEIDDEEYIIVKQDDILAICE